MTNKSIVEDVLSLGSDLLGQLVDARHDFKTKTKEHVGNVARGLDLVSREEFDAAFAMLAKARDMQEDIAARLSKIESHLGIAATPRAAKTKTKAAAGAKNKVKTAKKNLPSVKTKKKVRSGK